ncbi:MAG: thiolase family protein [Planctomycetes bacterium]|nr:thiolase family protein [Planctomycetota bacterium]
MRTAVITCALRTPIGKFLGSLSRLGAADLGAAVASEVVRRSGVDPARIAESYFGCARQAGTRTNLARQVAIRAGVPREAPATTINMACGSGLKSITLAAQQVALGEADFVLAGGTESMSRMPFFLDRMREGYRQGDAPAIDGMYRDGFRCPLTDRLMGETAETLAREYRISRRDQDEYAALSQQRCEAARRGGLYADETVAIEVPDPRGRGKAERVDSDEHPRDGVTAESLATLPPVFQKDGTVHAGSSSGITDGAAAVLVAAEDVARGLGMPVLGRITGWSQAGVDPERMGLGPVAAAARLRERGGLAARDFDLVELNEAFAAQVLACEREMGLERARLNVVGGAIALGHPIGATGARIVVTLLHAMARLGRGTGLATLCASGGMGLALAFERP